MSTKTHDTAWHSLEEQELLERVQSSKEGLAQSQANDRVAEVGPNSLEAEEGTSALKLLLRQVKSPLIYLLFAAAILSLVAGKNVDAGVILMVIVLNTTLGFVQEWRAEGALEALRSMSAPKARVLRDEKELQIAASEVVPGDVLVLETGEQVAADARVFQSVDLAVDESALTGESKPVRKRPRYMPVETPLAERENMVWMSCPVTGGHGRALVVETGMRTEMGKIAGEVQRAERMETPLQKRMTRLALFIAAAGMTLATSVFILGTVRGYELMEMLLFSVAVAVSATPSGLPAVITVTLALGVRRMVRHNALVRRLPAVETLGSTTVICSDKTGTLTKNQMTVVRLFAGEGWYRAAGEGYRPKGHLEDEAGKRLESLPHPLEMLLKIGALSNNAELVEEKGQWAVDGNPSEGSLKVVGMKGGFEPEALEDQYPRRDEIPFSSDAKYMATLHGERGGERRLALLKGAPERILAFSDRIQMDGEILPLDETRRQRIEAANKEMADDALRVMAGAYKDLPVESEELHEEEITSGLIFSGMWGIHDPPRPESRDAVKRTREAGIRTIMLTGDHAATALAIARKLDITQASEALTGQASESLPPEELARRAMEVGVFARVSPLHKRKILEALKESGQIVAMTGDGVNDAPALKGADIGVAMGRTGTEVAKEAADMVLTDDNFATLVEAVEEGRVIYGNLRRVVFFLPATSLGEIMTLVGALIIGLPLPLTAVMVLWVNLVTDGASSVPLGVEPRHSDVLKKAPRDPKEPILDKVLIRRMLLLAPLMAIGTLGLFYYALPENYRELSAADLAYPMTIAFTCMAAFQWFQALNARSETESIFSIGLFTNKWLLFGVGIAVALQIAAVESPVGQALLGTTGLSLRDWGLVVLVSSSIWIADESLKWLGVHGKPVRRR